MFIIELILIAYFIYVVSYTTFFAVGGLFYRPDAVVSSSASSKKFAVLIPGYKEDAIILDTLKANLKVDYPNDDFDLVAIADSYKKETLNAIKDLPVILHEVSFDKSTKVRALKESLSRLPDQYDCVVILDADNVMDVDFLKRCNVSIHQSGWQAIQGQRQPKNSNNKLAVLDGISEAINNHIYRQGAHSTGFSVQLSGSGMVFERGLFQELISQMDSIGGFDRELEYKFIERGIKVRYNREAIVFDQKTDDLKNFENQRKRWFASQYIHLYRFFGKGLSALLKGKVVYFHSTVWRNIQLPRLINLGLITMFTILAVLLRSWLQINYFIWPALWGVYALSFAMSIPRSFYNKEMLMAMIKLPFMFLTMILVMLKLRGANKKFIHTEHKPV